MKLPVRFVEVPLVVWGFRIRVRLLRVQVWLFVNRRVQGKAFSVEAKGSKTRDPTTCFISADC